jgi:hypothetical protein
VLPPAFSKGSTDADRRPPQAADPAAALARLHQCDREHDGDSASRQSQREALAHAAMALRWTAAGMLEATKGFRRLKAHKYLPVLRAALAAHQSKYVTQRVDRNADAG